MNNKNDSEDRMKSFQEAVKQFGTMVDNDVPMPCHQMSKLAWRLLMDDDFVGDDIAITPIINDECDDDCSVGIVVKDEFGYKTTDLTDLSFDNAKRYTDWFNRNTLGLGSIEADVIISSSMFSSNNESSLMSW